VFVIPALRLTNLLIQASDPAKMFWPRTLLDPNKVILDG
jgi:hypothetical protein